MKPSPTTPPFSEPELQPPGAGLPLVQMLFLRLWLGPIVSRRTPPQKCRANYEFITRRLVEKVSAIPAAQRNTKVLVQPIPGLEDSSRFWSLNGVLEHVIIVSKGIEAAVLSLAAGKVPSGVADTAQVKPKTPDHDFLAEFIAYAPDLMKRLDERLGAPDMRLESPLRYRHPWFGGLTARQWYWLLSSHQGIHYRQAKEIIGGLRSARLRTDQ